MVTFTPIPLKNICFLDCCICFFQLEGHMHCANHGNCWTKSSRRLKHVFVAPVFTRQYMFPTMGRRMVSTEQRRTRVERVPSPHLSLAVSSAKHLQCPVGQPASSATLLVPAPACKASRAVDSSMVIQAVNTNF